MTNHLMDHRYSTSPNPLSYAWRLPVALLLIVFYVALLPLLWLEERLHSRKAARASRS